MNRGILLLKVEINFSLRFFKWGTKEVQVNKKLICFLLNNCIYMAILQSKWLAYETALLSGSGEQALY